MDPSRFDAISKSFADRKLTRRRALMQGGAGIAAGAAALTGLSASADDATPETVQEATPAAADTFEKTEFLFIQSFQSGSIVPKEGEAGTWTLTLEQGLGQTVYFSDRPERIVGVSPTDTFLKGLGFSADNPPNAALLFENDKGEEDISVVELFNPVYDTATNTATYEIQLLKEYAGLGMTFQEQPAEPPDAGATFGAAHLFIDDCADYGISCCSQWNNFTLECENPYVGSFPSQGYCYSFFWAHCLPCDPYGHDVPHQQNNPVYDYWNTQCNNTYSECNGICQSIFWT